MTLAINVTVDEQDFADVASKSEKEVLFGKARVLGGREERREDEIIEEMLPKVIAEKIKRMVPDDFVLSEILINANVSGKVFGSGIAGTFSMKLVKKDSVDS